MTQKPATIIGVLHLRFDVPAESLKDKRSVVQPVLARLRGKFNCSAGEVDDLDDISHATIAVACVSNDSRHCDSMLQSIVDYVEHERFDAELIAVNTELVHV